MQKDAGGSEALGRQVKDDFRLLSEVVEKSELGVKTRARVSKGSSRLARRQEKFSRSKKV